MEYSTDIVFGKQSDLQAIYERLTRAAIHTVKPDNIATFLGRKLNGNYQDEMGNRFNTRIEGTRIKHSNALSSSCANGTGVDQNVRQVPADFAHRNHWRKSLKRIGEQRFLLQALPRGRTQRWHTQHGVGGNEENHLQSGTTTRTFIGGQPPLLGIHFHH